MPKRNRDYAAEYRRRKELSQAKTGKTPYQRRKERLADTAFNTPSQVQRYRKRVNDSPSRFYHIPKKVPGYTSAQLADAHFQAFEGPRGFAHLNKDRTTHRVRGKLSSAIKEWYVDILGVYTSGEFDAKYGTPSN